MTRQSNFFGLTLGLCAIAILPTQTAAFTSFDRRETVPNRPTVAQYKPPSGMGAPPDATPGGTRDGKCEQDREVSGPYLTALVPNLPSNNNWGATLDANPQFFVYLPKTAARKAEFVLKDEEQNDIYRKSFPISGTGGVIAVSLPKNVASLKVGQNYNWYFTIFCNVKDRSSNPSTNAWTKRGEINSSLAAQIQKATDRDRFNLYAENGIWHEAVASLVELRRQNPNDPALAAEWKKLLESAGIKEIGDIPFAVTQIGD